MKSTYRNVCGTVLREKIHKFKAAENDHNLCILIIQRIQVWVSILPIKSLQKISYQALYLTFNIQQMLSRYHGNILLRFMLRIPVNTFWQTVFSSAGLFRSQCDQMQEKTTEEETNELLSRGKTKCQNTLGCVCATGLSVTARPESKGTASRLPSVPAWLFTWPTVQYHARIIAPSAWITVKVVSGSNCKNSFRRTEQIEALRALWFFNKAISH